MGKVAKSKRAGSKNATRTDLKPTADALNDMSFWRKLAGLVCPDEGDAWKIGEIALALNEYAKLLGGNWEKIDKLVSQTKNDCISIGIGLDIDRADTPSEVRLKIGFGVRHNADIKATVPDPNQKELPIFSDKATEDEDRVLPTTGEGQELAARTSNGVGD